MRSMTSVNGMSVQTVIEQLSRAAGHPESCSCALHVGVLASLRPSEGVQLSWRLLASGSWSVRRRLNEGSPREHRGR